MTASMEFRLLGPLEVRRNGAGIPVKRGKQRQILAALLLNPGRLVSIDELMVALWDAAPPPSARQSVHNCVMRLRHTLGEAAQDRITTQPGGYLIRADQDEIDVARFEIMLQAARSAAQAGVWPVAASKARAALALWRGEPLADVESELLAVREVPRLTELRLQAQETAADATLHLDRASEVISELQRLTADHPLRERLHQLLMLALYRDGRQAEALAWYQQARRILADELGSEPGAGLRQLQQRILAADPALAVIGPADSPAAGRSAVPRELPAPVRHFVGRGTELRELNRLLDQSGARTHGAMVISAIGGMAGVGKTALAVEWAHGVAARFPDGQLYIDLRGYDPDEPMDAAEALARFLRALGLPGQDIPAEGSERAARFRSLLADRRVLMVLDNAKGVEQVRPLLPGSPGCVAVVTSRDSLAGLIARDGAARVDLDLLAQPAALSLLRALIGARVDAEADAARTLAARCARLPLALRIAAELAIARPDVSLRALADELADEQRGLDLLNAGGDPRTGVRAVFSWSYRNLAADEARLFRLLGLPPGATVDLYAAAALAGAAVADTRRQLEALARAHLIQPAGPDPDRFLLHDLLRAFARELAQTDDDERRDALTRLFDHYLHTAGTAMETLFPAERHRRPQICPCLWAAPDLTHAEAARAWLDAELSNLVAAAGYAAENGWPGHTTRLSGTLFRYLGGGGHFPEATVIHTHAVKAARAIGDRDAEAAALSCLSQIDLHYGRSQQATSQLRQALLLLRDTEDWAAQARILHNLATVEVQEGQYRQAGQHHQHALILHQSAGNQAGVARALHGLSDVDLRLGHYDRAEANLARARALCQEIGDRVNEAYIMALTGDLSLRLGNCRDAETQLERALSMFRETGDQTGEAWALAHLGAAHLGLGRDTLAIEYHQQARTVAGQTNDLFGEAEALNGLGEAYLATGQTAEARIAHTCALGLARQTGDRYEQARAQAGLAQTHQADDPERALDHWQEAFALYDDLGTPEAAQIRTRLQPH